MLRQNCLIRYIIRGEMKVNRRGENKGWKVIKDIIEYHRQRLVRGDKKGSMK